MKTDRVGKIRLSHTLLEDFGKYFIKFCYDNNFLIIRAENNFITDEITYEGYCDLFDPVAIGERMKEYTLRVNSICIEPATEKNYARYEHSLTLEGRS